MQLQMNGQANDQGVPDVSAGQRASNEMIKLIRKLRWMGLESEAQQLQFTLKSAPPADCLAAEPRETD